MKRLWKLTDFASLQSFPRLFQLVHSLKGWEIELIEKRDARAEWLFFDVFVAVTLVVTP